MDKIETVREQKRQLRERIIKLQGEKVEENQLDEKTLALLLEKKQRIEHKKLEQEKYRKMEAEYMERRKEVQRQKQLEKILNEKRLIELQVGMRKIVLNGVKEKVKGMNSEQLMTRAFLNEGEDSGHKKHIKSKLEIKNEFQKYLETESVNKEKPKYDVFALNEQRFKIFEKKEEMIMRQILLKDALKREKHLQVDVMKLNKSQLQKLMEQKGISVEDYMQPVPKEDILSTYGQMEERARRNIHSKEEAMGQQRLEKQKLQKERQQLRNWISQHDDADSIKIVNSILEHLIDHMVLEYEQRHFEGTEEEKQQRIDVVKKQYERVLFENQAAELAEQITNELCSDIRNQALEDVVEEVFHLNELCHETTKLSIDWAFLKNDFTTTCRNKEKQLERIELNFAENDFGDYGDSRKPPGIEVPGSGEEERGNVFETEDLTKEMINDLKLLSSEEQYFERVEVRFQNEIQVDSGEPKLFFENELFVVTESGISQFYNRGQERRVIEFDRPIKDIRTVQKFNNFWVVQNGSGVTVFSDWNKEALPSTIGERINGLCGSTTCVQIYPIFTLLGSLCTLLIGFEKGQILKYNFNRNRINNQQTNVTYHQPLGPSVKTGDEPAFPLNNRQAIVYTHMKAKEGEELHEFRQFFDHHTQEVIAVLPYKPNYFISVDKSLQCAIWNYQTRRGAKCYEPLYNFKIESTFKIYKESENSRFKDLFPSDNVLDKAEQLYQKWMQQESFLSLQIYNNPKKSTAFFKSPKWDDTQSEQPIWKITYDERKQKVIKIYETYYNIIDGKIQAKMALIWRQYLMVLVEREHPMRTDLKTMKIYTWNIEERKMLSVAIEFDTFKDQKKIQFAVLQNQMASVDFPLVSVISSGKILVFSLLSGQLLKNLSEENSPENNKFSKYYYNSIISGNSTLFALSRKGVIEVSLDDRNTTSFKQSFGKIVELSRKKHNNLI